MTLIKVLTQCESKYLKFFVVLIIFHLVFSDLVLIKTGLVLSRASLPIQYMLITSLGSSSILVLIRFFIVVQSLSCSSGRVAEDSRRLNTTTLFCLLLRSSSFLLSICSEILDYCSSFSFKVETVFTNLSVDC